MVEMKSEISVIGKQSKNNIYNNDHADTVCPFLVVTAREARCAMPRDVGGASA
jgi:hypothetical protein